jgi:hypothetical protein
MASSPEDRADPTPVPSRKVCYLSRTKGWSDPEHPRRPVSEINLLAIHLGSRVWTLETAWAAVFGTSLIPPEVARAYRNATAHVAVSEGEVRILRDVAERLRIELRVIE